MSEQVEQQVGSEVESKIVLTHRLQRENRWVEATAWLDQKRQQLRDEGLTRREANAQAWAALAAQFPPLEPAPGDDGDDGEGAFAAEPLGPLSPEESARIPRAGHPVYDSADTDLEIWAGEYDIPLTPQAKDYLSALLGVYWGNGKDGVIPPVDVFAR